jgi:hypothetical protein
MANSLPPGPIDTNAGTADKGTGSELDDDEQHEADDLADLKRRIEAMAIGSEERKMGVREWRRLKRIPQGSVENGVIRTYVRLFLFPSYLSSPRVIAAGMAHFNSMAKLRPSHSVIKLDI